MARSSSRWLLLGLCCGALVAAGGLLVSALRLEWVETGRRYKSEQKLARGLRVVP